MILQWVNVLYPRGGGGVPCPSLFDVVGPFCVLSGTICLILLSFWVLCRISPSSPIYLRVWAGWRFCLFLGSLGALTWTDWARRWMYAYIVSRQPGPPDAPVCGPHQSDGDPSLEVSKHPRVVLLPICCEADGYTFQGSRHLHTQYPINGGNKWRIMLTLMEACLQVHLLPHLFFLLKTIYRRLSWMGISISVHEAHVP